MTPADMVREFHEATGLPVRDVGALPRGDERALLARMTKDAAHEAAQGIGGRFIEAAARGLAQVVYVAYRAALHYGIDLDAAVAQFHADTMREHTG